MNEASMLELTAVRIIVLLVSNAVKVAPAPTVEVWQSIPLRH
ncbi:uncharacterized protein RCC_12130 [Ramularia collo-cygni]|uniref:Uncharacterized protein n=1 Tax=Ramularia collo-cygni TaxID=112498 RepID=A0A2D3UW96_9PEZI|nr:uncharacterized protein RCC_12130 [Ramularia collo-cygni]CZT22072.1 uncharacterized protein RCC_12130 [Ramularia collo-cygni]